MFSSYKGFKNQDFSLPLLAGEGLGMGAHFSNGL
jgi:hypothetical protein